ncbi:MAG: hypothetical protein H6825_05935 [Planctomycetes bacterium]|nr:hypothetical protein [Planctomycetota bacterium]
MTSRRSGGCLWTLLVGALVLGAFALLLTLDADARRALGARPFVRLEWSLAYTPGLEDELRDALARVPHERFGMTTDWARFEDTLRVTVELPGDEGQTDALRALVEERFDPAWQATWRGARPVEQKPLWVGRVTHRLRRIGSRVHRWIEGDGGG